MKKLNEIFSWQRRRSSKELGSFVARKLNALEGVELDLDIEQI